MNNIQDIPVSQREPWAQVVTIVMPKRVLREVYGFTNVVGFDEPITVTAHSNLWRQWLGMPKETL